jgi:hypothetical protein
LRVSTNIARRVAMDTPDTNEKTLLGSTPRAGYDTRKPSPLTGSLADLK